MRTARKLTLPEPKAVREIQAVIGIVSYVPCFALFPITRDFPWVNLLLLGGGAILLWVPLIFYRGHRCPLCNTRSR